MAKKKNKWDDHYSRLARKEKQPARSVYKLQEIQKKYKVIKKGNKILDLGCSPGSWLLYAADLTGPRGYVTGIDKKQTKINLPANARFFQGDILEPENSLANGISPEYDVVMSDMAPATTGNKHVDGARSVRLCRAALSIALEKLAPGGSFICKIFQGEDFKEFSNYVKICFAEHKIFKPQSCRKASREIYIIGKGKKQEELCQDIANGLP